MSFQSYVVGKSLKDKRQKEEKSSRKNRKKRKGSSLSTVLLTLILFAGIVILLYPTASDWWNSMHATHAIASYVENVEDLSGREVEAMLEAARKYNSLLSNGANFDLTEEEYEEYEKYLDISGTGIMGYIQIPAISVNLPVYHSVDEGILQVAVGHIPGSSLPVGGERTHSVMSGHRGLPSAKLFSDLDQIREGDIFTINVLNQVITYMVDQIRIVLPDETGDLAIENGKDYCTLITCTPYGVNTHRMLVRGRRIDNLPEEVIVTAEAVRIPNYVVIPAIGIPLLFVTLAGMLIYSSVRGRKPTKRELLDDLRKRSG